MDSREKGESQNRIVIVSTFGSLNSHTKVDRTRRSKFQWSGVLLSSYCKSRIASQEQF